MPILEALSPATLPHGVVAGRRFSSLEAYKNTAGYGATLLVALAAMTATLQLWRVDWRVPFDYKNDNLMGQMFIQNILESGWALDGPAPWRTRPPEPAGFPIAGRFAHRNHQTIGIFLS